ncbi:MAG TPA: PEP-CTERM sorting domain-containing protein [Tepidisphaeraceae bacterium]|nr:PEP-CTERM sorting domain-containing protein [Tepidisphaeraceae bacterium]
MHLKRASLGAILLLAMLVADPLVVRAAFVPWTNPSGSNGLISWSGGGSTDDLWGSPTVSGLTFTFHPDQFRANSSNGNAVTTDGMLRFDVDILATNPNTNQPLPLQGFRIDELGSYSILGIGNVQATGLLVVSNRDNFGQVYTDTLHTVAPLGGFPVSVGSPSGSAAGAWNGFMEVTAVQLIGTDIIHFTITVDNTLQATSVAGSTSFIDKKLAGAGIQISIVLPEPSTLGLLASGLPVLLRRRRK